MKSFGRLFKIVGTTLMIVVLSGGGVVGYVIRSPMPQTVGTIRVVGLQNPVEVFRDGWGVPHIYAASAHDLFFAQGYVHAQDRFWQMEFWRRIGAGRLSEILGPAALDRDLFLRTVGWARSAAEDEKALDADTRFALQSYADGVNAYLDAHQNLGLEFAVLKINGVDYQPEPWTVVNTLTWAKVMSWDLGDNMSAELNRAMLIQKVGYEAMVELKPPYPTGHPIILPDPAVGSGGDYGETLAALEPAMRRLQAATDDLRALTGGGFDGVGSNNWVIAGSRTDTGKPYLANDPHLAIQMPSIWYEVGLHCRQIADYCPYDMVGFSFPGAPGVIIGHNQRIAWGVTNLGPDVQDLYMERFNPDNPRQYEVNGEWVEAQIISEVIVVRGRVEPDPDNPARGAGIYNAEAGTTSVPLAVRVTRHGPIISDVHGTARRLSGNVNGVDLPPAAGLALRWTALEPIYTFRAVLGIGRARNFDEFRAALRDWTVPSQNFVYADVDGNIGYQTPGNIPIRANGDGLLPVPGWTDDYEWVGYIPFDDLPFSYNPPQGYIATANNAVVGPDYPYLISLDWDRGYRARRIADMIEAQRGRPITLDDVQAQQGDNANLSAQEVLPYLAGQQFDKPKVQAGLELLKGWDFQQHMDSAPAALYNLFWVRLVADTFYDELQGAESLWPGPGADTMLAIRQLLEQPDNHWWDNVRTADRVERRDDILRQALAEAVAEAEGRMGADTADWAWGKLHTATFRNQTLGQSGIGPIEILFNRGPARTSGGPAIVNATGYRIARPGDGRTDAPTFEVTSVPSMRMIIDLADFGRSVAMHTTGQSGHPFSRHYDDMIGPWRMIEYHPMLWDRASVEAAQRALLTLAP